MSTRAATPVLGIALLFGFTIAAALALFATGGVLIESTQSSIEDDQAQESMEDVAATVDQTVAGPQTAGEFSFDGAGEGTPRVEEDSGQFRIIQNDTERYNEPIGALEFHHDDTTLAYQGGAVWRTDRDGDAVMIQPPNVHYNFRTLTVPIINITGDVTAEQQTGELRLGDTTRLYPGADDDPNPLQNGTVKIEIESEQYCNGWEEYFSQQAEGSLDQQCGGDDTLAVEFSVPFQLGEEFSAPATVRSVNDDEDEDYDIDVQGKSYDVEPSSILLDDKRQECRERHSQGNMPVVEDEYSQGGLHCVDRIDSNVEANTQSADEEIQIYVENGIDLDESSLTDLDDRITLFVDGDLDIVGSNTIGDENNVTNLVMFFAGGVEGGSGTPEIHGLIYAADSDVRFSGNVEFYGSIVAEELRIDGGGNPNEPVLNFPEQEFEDFQLEYDTGGAPFYFLHIVETEVEFSN